MAPNKRLHDKMASQKYRSQNRGGVFAMSTVLFIVLFRVYMLGALMFASSSLVRPLAVGRRP